MGIHGLSKVLGDYAPSSMKENDIKSYFGRKVAIDASMSLYQFLIAVRQDGQQLVDSSGETTSHLLGFFYRTIRMVENGIKPVYVFDGKPPVMKSGELAKRAERRAEAQQGLAKAEEQGDTEGVEKFQKRLVKVTPNHTAEAKRLLSLMGVPYVEAPCEAEAQCAALTRAGKVYATATEDMDALTFGTTVLLRNLTASESRKLPVKEINLDRALADLGMGQTEFIDLCILLGCDYCDSIRGIGPVKAINLMRQHKTIEKVVDCIKREGKKSYQIPEEWPYEDARRLFVEPDVTDPDKIELKWGLPDEQGLVEFLVEEKGFAEDRIRSGARKLVKSKQGATQGRMDSFFKAVPSPIAENKRKATDKHDRRPLKRARVGGRPRGK